MMKHNVPPFELELYVDFCYQSVWSTKGFGSSESCALPCFVGDLRVARKVFDEMPDKSVVVWNEMISGYEQNGFAEGGSVLLE
ncbi:hypothetical protein LIER_08981 [Lithospermum erythrorhizon]|uniref:Pentatricopeptide repeat-containing protein n=1 Tax=Lithospermum erythrorhizon TaxID=34254 RepID=A0AAV3PIC4_LITER